MLTRDQLDQINRLLDPLFNRIANSSARLVIQLVDDSAMQQLLQAEALEGEVIDDGEHFQPYGFTAHPLPGAEGVALFPNGDRGHPIVLVVSDRRYRPTDGLPGEVVVYNHTGTEIRIDALGQILMGAAGAAVDAAIKGTTRNAAEQTFLAAMATFVAAMLDAGVPSAARATFAAAITAFQAAATASLSLKVKLE